MGGNRFVIHRRGEDVCFTRLAPEALFGVYFSIQLPVACACVVAGAIYVERGITSIVGTASSSPKTIGQLGSQGGGLPSLTAVYTLHTMHGWKSNVTTTGKRVYSGWS